MKILVKNDTQKFWVKDPKKIQHWENIAKLSEKKKFVYQTKIIKRVDENEK